MTNDPKCILIRSRKSVGLFTAAKQMIDIADCRDVASLQAIVFIIIFLQCSGSLSTCYNYLGFALRSAIRMGMHRKIDTNFTPIERETRRRIFWVLKKTDIYVSTVLGLPATMTSNDVDQELPAEIDDEFILGDSILPQPDGRLAGVTATNTHVRLIEILTKIVTRVYAIRGTKQKVNERGKVYLIEDSKICEIQVCLQQWLDQLPKPLNPSSEISQKLTRYVISSRQLMQ